MVCAHMPVWERLQLEPRPGQALAMHHARAVCWDSSGQGQRRVVALS